MEQDQNRKDLKARYVEIQVIKLNSSGRLTSTHDTYEKILGYWNVDLVIQWAKKKSKT